MFHVKQHLSKTLNQLDLVCRSGSTPDGYESPRPTDLCTLGLGAPPRNVFSQQYSITNESSVASIHATSLEVQRSHLSNVSRETVSELSLRGSRTFFTMFNRLQDHRHPICISPTSREISDELPKVRKHPTVPRWRAHSRSSSVHKREVGSESWKGCPLLDLPSLH